MVGIEDRPGALGELTRRLADANVNVELAYTTFGGVKVVIATDDLISASARSVDRARRSDFFRREVASLLRPLVATISSASVMSRQMSSRLLSWLRLQWQMTGRPSAKGPIRSSREGSRSVRK